MIMKYLILLLLFPFLSLAQQADEARLYLSYDNQLTTRSSNLKCVFNPKLSKNYVLTYDCYNANHQLIKQLNRKPRLYAEAYSVIAKPYFKNMPNSITDTYLIGDMKNGKPFNGFFMYTGSNIWLIFDFYLNGKRLFQVYSDLLTAGMVKDTETSFTAIGEKNTFVNGRLQSGIEVTPVTVKRGVADIVRMAKIFRTTGFVLTLFDRNSAESIEIRPITDGYELTCMYKNSIRVTYHASGRRFTFYDWKNRKSAKPERLNSDLYSITLEKLAYALKYKSVDAETLKKFIIEQW